MTAEKYPPLPAADFYGSRAVPEDTPLYTAEQVHAAIDAAREQDCARAAAPQAAVGVSDEREAFKAAHAKLDLTEVPDAWNRPKFAHSHVDAMWAGWLKRAVLTLSPASKPEAPAADCGNCFEGETDRGHKCKVCGGTGKPAEAPANEGEDAAHRITLDARDLFGYLREAIKDALTTDDNSHDQAGLWHDATHRTNAVMAALAAPAQGDAKEMADSIAALAARHQEVIDAGNHYAYFELAYTRQTGWMAWITDKPLCAPVVNPDRKVLFRGQGGTPAEACDDALRAARQSKGGAA